MSASNIPVLHYTNGRGRAESIRLMLTAAGVDWTEQHIKEKEDLEKIKEAGLLLFEQVPLLQWDSVNMVQSGPIIRHIARKYNFYGKPGEEFQVDMLTEGARDFLMPFMAIGFIDKIEEIRTNYLPRYMPIFEKVLTSSKSGFLVGDGMTMADVCLLEVLLFLPEVTPEGFDGHPKCKEFYNKMKSEPRLAAYLNSSKRHAPNSPEYCANVRKIFNF